jgi:hypothetical protein
MRILTAHVENHQGWSQTEVLVQENGVKAFVFLAWTWEDRDGEVCVLWSEGGFDGGDTLVDRLRAADGYDKLVDSQIEVLV